MTFDDVRRELVARLQALTGGEFLVVGEPQPAPQKRGLLRRAALPPVRYVQFRRDESTGMLYGECVGAALFGGDWDLSEVDHERIRALGWLAPGDPDPTGTQPEYPNYWCCLERERADQAAAIGAGALEVLGVAPQTLEWRSG